MNEAMALTNCPKVSCAARFLPPVTSAMSGLREVCIRALPMPSRENDSSMTVKLSSSRGMSREMTVTMRESSTVFFLPILFISMPVGTLKMRNQKNTSDGRMLAIESLSPRSFFT